MDLKVLCLLGLVTGLRLNEVISQDAPSSASGGTSTSFYYYNNENEQTLCYFVDGQPLCGEEGQKARDADRERIKRLRDGSGTTLLDTNGVSQRDPRGDLASLPQGDSPFQDDGPVSHPRNTGANNYKGHVRPNNDKGHVRPTLPPPTRPPPTRPPTPPPTTRRPCPPPTTPRPTCPPPPRTTTTQAPSPCYPEVTSPPPCPYATTEHPDIAEWRRTRNRNRRPSYQSDQNQPRSDFYRNRQAWISASTGMQNDGTSGDQELNNGLIDSENSRGKPGTAITGNSEGWWEVNKQRNAHNSIQQHRSQNTQASVQRGRSSRNTIYRSSRTFERDHQGVSRIPEINVRRNGVILSVVNDQPKLGLPHKNKTSSGTIPMGQNNGGFLRARLNYNKRKKLRLYQYFQKKEQERKQSVN